MKSIRLALFLLACLVPASALAQEPATPSEDPLVKKLLERIEALEKRVAELEGRQVEQPAEAAPLPTPEAPAPEPTTTTAATTAHMDVMEEAQTVYPNLKLRGFTDIDFSTTDQPDQPRGFNEGQFVFHLSSALSPRISFFGEVAFTARESGFVTTVERSIIRLDHSDYLKLSFGRYHTPVNWWNTAFHHGLWLQTTITRPEMARIGGVFIPVHFVGGLVEGSVPAGGLNFNYNVGLGNGRDSSVRNPGDAGDNNSNRAWIANFFIRPVHPFGLQAGGSAYRDKITLSDGRDFREWIGAAHFVWLRENPEIITEFANVRHRSVNTGEVFDNQGLYVQLAYRLPFMDNAFKPYYRYEYIDVATGDPVFLGLESLRGSIIGVRYDFSFFAALKAEFRHLGRPDGVDTNGGFMQISFTF